MRAAPRRKDNPMPVKVHALDHLVIHVRDVDDEMIERMDLDRHGIILSSRCSAHRPHWPPRALFVTTRDQFNKNGRALQCPSGRNCMASRRAAIGLLAIGISAMAWVPGASALDYPVRPVRWIVGYPPGGATDIIARL